ncbi:MAG: hypothetical protein QOC71_1435 [Thermoplasmata archaeon]|nr:hypothetical protein [Thermoplasmata archaeon]
MITMTVMTVMAKAVPVRNAPARATTFTTVPVKPETLRRLRSYKVGGKTYDDVLNEFMDETPTEAFWKEMDRRMKEEPRIPWDDVKKRLKL